MQIKNKLWQMGGVVDMVTSSVLKQRKKNLRIIDHFDRLTQFERVMKSNRMGHIRRRVRRGQLLADH